VLDQPCGQQGLTRIAETEDGGAPDVPVTHQVGNDGRNHRALATGNRAPCPSAIRRPRTRPQRARTGQRHQVWRAARGSAAPRRNRLCQPQRRAQPHQSTAKHGLDFAACSPQRTIGLPYMLPRGACQSKRR